jgi:hypothetical protein
VTLVRIGAGRQRAPGPARTRSPISSRHAGDSNRSL